MKKIIKKIIGSTEDRSFEQTLFIGIIVYDLMMCTITTIINILNGLYFQVFLTSSLIVLCSVVYYFARFRKRYFFVFSLVFTAVAICLSYFNELGINGPIPFFLIVFLIFILVYNPLKWHFKIFIFLVLSLCTVFSIEYLFPQLVENPFKTQAALHIHLILGIMFCISLSFASIYFLRKSYDHERNKNQQQKAL